jgi:hypothetical protein
MGKLFVKQNITYLALVLFFITFCIIIMTKPAFIYNNDGSFKQFGVGYKNKSVLPMWFIVILISILSYVSILYAVTFASPRY